jgi:hypothetical protein
MKAKILPFNTEQGHVPGHEIALHQPVQSVVFWTFDREADMGIEILIHWTELTKYLKKKWPRGGEVRAVILEDGTRIHASGVHACHNGSDAYRAAPILCRDMFRVVGLISRSTLVEVVGVHAWLHSKRDDAATAEHLPCPWERDNRAYRESLAS